MGNANRIDCWNEIGLGFICFNLVWWSVPPAAPLLHPHILLEFRWILRAPFLRGE